jgi:hypothetical protein
MPVMCQEFIQHIGEGDRIKRESRIGNVSLVCRVGVRIEFIHGENRKWDVPLAGMDHFEVCIKF